MIKEIKLGEIATFSQGQQVSIPDQKTEWFENSDIFLRIINYTQNSDDFRFIPKQDKKYHISKDDIIMVRYGAVGFVGRGLEGVLANNMFRINFDKKQITPNYLFRVLWSNRVQKQLLNASQSTSMAAINFKTVSRVKIPLPPLPIQKKIAAILDEADRLRQLNQQVLDKYDALSQSVFLEMFGDIIKNSKSFPVKKLKEIAKISRGRFSIRPRNDPRYFNGKYPFIQTGEISKSNHRLSKYKQTLNELGIKVSKEFKIGTVVIAIVGATIGETAILEIDTYAPDSIIGIEVNAEVSNAIYIENLLRFWRPIFIARAPATARANINIETLKPLPIPLPTLDLQNHFAQSIKAIETQKSKAQAALKKSEDLFNSLLQRAFKGELVG